MPNLVPWTIESKEDLDRALAAVLELDTRKELIDADLTRRQSELIQSFKDEYLVPAAGGTELLDNKPAATIDDVRAQAMVLIKEYCESHRDDLLSGKTQSVKLDHGSIGWKKQPDVIEVAKLTKAEEAKGVLAHLKTLALAALNGIRKVFTIDAIQVAKLTVAWDKSALMKLYEEGKIKDAQLKTAGLKFVEGESQFFAKPCLPDK